MHISIIFFYIHQLLIILVPTDLTISIQNEIIILTWRVPTQPKTKALYLPSLAIPTIFCLSVCQHTKRNYKGEKKWKGYNNIKLNLLGSVKFQQKTVLADESEVVLAGGI